MSNNKYPTPLPQLQEESDQLPTQLNSHHHPQSKIQTQSESSSERSSTGCRVENPIMLTNSDLSESVKDLSNIPRKATQDTKSTPTTEVTVPKPGNVGDLDVDMLEVPKLPCSPPRPPVTEPEDPEPTYITEVEQAEVSEEVKVGDEGGVGQKSGPQEFILSPQGRIEERNFTSAMLEEVLEGKLPLQMPEGWTAFQLNDQIQVYYHAESHAFSLTPPYGSDQFYRVLKTVYGALPQEFKDETFYGILKSENERLKLLRQLSQDLNNNKEVNLDEIAKTGLKVTQKELTHYHSFQSILPPKYKPNPSDDTPPEHPHNDSSLDQQIAKLEAQYVVKEKEQQQIIDSLPEPDQELIKKVNIDQITLKNKEDQLRKIRMMNSPISFITTFLMKTLNVYPLFEQTDFDLNYPGDDEKLVNQIINSEWQKDYKSEDVFRELLRKCECYIMHGEEKIVLGIGFGHKKKAAKDNASIAASMQFMPKLCYDAFYTDFNYTRLIIELKTNPPPTTRPLTYSGLIRPSQSNPPISRRQQKLALKRPPLNPNQIKHLKIVDDDELKYTGSQTIVDVEMVGKQVQRQNLPSRVRSKSPIPVMSRPKHISAAVRDRFKAPEMKRKPKQVLKKGEYSYDEDGQVVDYKNKGLTQSISVLDIIPQLQSNLDQPIKFASQETKPLKPKTRSKSRRAKSSIKDLSEVSEPVRRKSSRISGRKRPKLLISESGSEPKDVYVALSQSDTQ